MSGVQTQRAAAQSQVNWTSTNANPEGTNFVQQDQVGPGDVGSLGVSWVLPFPASPSTVPGLSAPGQGAMTPPLVVDGVVYVTMSDLEVMAVDASDGAVLWTYTPILNVTGLPLGLLEGHVHGMTYHDGDVWVNLPDCSVVALDGATGDVARRVTGLCAGVPGNAGLYDYSGTPVVFYRDVMVWMSSVSEGTDAGRGVVVGYNLTSGESWRWYVTPPAGGDPDWDADSCPPTSCTGNVQAYPGDWGNMSLYDGRARGGAGPGWGQAAVDGEDGLVILGTSQPSPDWNATFRQGPDLYSDSIVALDASDGRMTWFYQTTPHDLFDFDCGWNVALANVTVDGEDRTVAFKACKNGYLYALDAKSGASLWAFDPPSVVRLNTQNAEYTSTGTYDPAQPWIDYPSTGQFEQCPGEYGAIESDIAVAYGKVYVAVQNLCSVGKVSDVSGFGDDEWGASGLLPVSTRVNTTIYAVDAQNGTAAWSNFLQGEPFRGWLTATGGLVFASTLGGSILALDAQTGGVDGEVRVGPGLYEGVTVGSASDGTVMLFQLVSSSSYLTSVQGVPGALLAYSVQGGGSSAPDDTLPWTLAGALGAVVTVLLVDRALLMKKDRAQKPAGTPSPRTSQTPIL